MQFLPVVKSAFQHSHSSDIKLMLDRSRVLRFRAYMRISLVKFAYRYSQSPDIKLPDIFDAKCNYNDPSWCGV
jgi:hypothetical protein